MSGNEDKAPVRFPWPPLILVGTLAFGRLVEAFVPSPWFGSPLADMLAAVGALIVAAAVALEIATALTLYRAHTTIRPDRKVDHLITKGPFAFSRNPIYLGNASLIFGLGLLTGIVWLLPLAFVDAWLTQKIAIEAEERHIEARFGKAYRDYRHRVRRWM